MNNPPSHHFRLMIMEMNKKIIIALVSMKVILMIIIKILTQTMSNQYKAERFLEMITNKTMI